MAVFRKSPRKITFLARFFTIKYFSKLVNSRNHGNTDYLKEEADDLNSIVREIYLNKLFRK